MLAFAITNTIFDEDLGTAFLLLPYQFLKDNNIDENKLSSVTAEFSSTVAIVVKGYPRGFIIYEKGPGIIKISARGSSYGNKINLPKVLAGLGGRSGGHFNACGATIHGDFNQVKNKLLQELKKYLKI